MTVFVIFFISLLNDEFLVSKCVIFPFFICIINGFFCHRIFFFSVTEESNLGSPLSHIAKFAGKRAGP